MDRLTSGANNQISKSPISRLYSSVSYPNGFDWIDTPNRQILYFVDYWSEINQIPMTALQSIPFVKERKYFAGQLDGKPNYSNSCKSLKKQNYLFWTNAGVINWLQFSHEMLPHSTWHLDLYNYFGQSIIILDIYTFQVNRNIQSQPEIFYRLFFRQIG